MRSAVDPTVARAARIGFFIALAAALHAAESLLPSPAPWFRVGLGNALLLAALHLWGARDAFWVGLGKVVLGGLAAGRLLSPGFFLSLGGTAAAWATMAVALRFASPPLGFVGVSILGAAAHAAAQLALAAGWLVGSAAVWALAPMLGVAALLSGAAVGAAAGYVARAVEEEPERASP